MPSSSAPAHSVIESALRNAVRQVHDSGNLENLTLKRVRKAVEETLGLDEGFFKKDSFWHEASKHIIQSEVDAHAEPTSPPTSLHKAVSPNVRQKKTKTQTIGKKHGLINKAGTGGQRKKGPDDDLTIDDDSRAYDEKTTTTKAVTVAKSSPPPPIKAGDEEGIEEVVNGSGENSSRLDAEGAESEMSEVLDEAPKPRRKRKSSESERGMPKKKAKTAKVAKADQSTDPDTEEIKRLQGWLVKCGIRKMWYRELQPYETPKAKIRHLKEMLADAGMTGRYSAEKASQIREERELKADLDAVQAGNKQWGMEEPEEDVESKPRRRLAKGLKELDFLNDDDGEETE